jgi:hypothetical protein
VVTNFVVMNFAVITFAQAAAPRHEQLPQASDPGHRAEPGGRPDRF